MVKWILNERALVKCDHAYALTRYCRLKSDEGMIQRFTFRLAQKILFELIAQLEEEGVAIEIMILKARQLGMTSVVQLLILLRIAFGYGVNAVAASAEVEKSGLMANKLFMAYDLLPVWLKPRYTARAEEGDSRKLVFAQLNTILSIQHGNKMKGGVAQGWTPTIYHLTETALFQNPSIQIDMGLWKAVHASPYVLGVLESTGSGDQGWWADTWRYSKNNWSNRSCRMCPLFLPWFIGRELYPTPTWIKMHPIPESFHGRRLPDTREHVAKAQSFVRSTPTLRRHLGAQWEMPLDQQWFWEVGHEEAKSKGQEGEALWYQEMAGDDLEALQRSSESVFGFDVITEVTETKHPTVAAYGFSGQSIEDAHEPSPEVIDYDRDRIPILFQSVRGERYRWELIPLKHDPDYLDQLAVSNPDAFWDYGNTGRFFVFHPPSPDVAYSIGVDTGGGQGRDSTTISVSIIGDNGMPDVQAAEFRSAYVSHVEAFAFTLAIAAWYGQFAQQAASVMRLPLIGIEQLAAVGDTCQLQMRKMGYPAGRFFRFGRYDSTKTKQYSNKLGWFTTSWSRPLLIDGFIHAITNHWYRLNSPWTIYECAHFETHYTAAGKEKKEHEEGSHDDGIFATAISTFIAHDTDTMANRTKHRFMGTEDARSLPPIDISPYRGHSVSTGRNPVVRIHDLVYASSRDLDRFRR